MAKKMGKCVWKKGIMFGAAAIMLCVNLFSWKFSSIRLILAVALASLAVFFLGGNFKPMKSSTSVRKKDSHADQENARGFSQKKDSHSGRKGGRVR